MVNQYWHDEEKNSKDDEQTLADLSSAHPPFASKMFASTNQLH